MTMRLRPFIPDLICAAAVVAVAAAGLATDHPVCLWRAVVGVPCPGCGMTRAFVALACGDFHSAWRLNPGSFAAAPILFGTAVQRLWPRRQPNGL